MIRITYVFLENPYLRLRSNMFVNASTGNRPILMYTIAVDADGTREDQKSLASIALFEFRNQSGNFNYSLNLAEFIETPFQHYSYALPTLVEENEGDYTLTLGCYTYNYNMSFNSYVPYK